MSLSPVRPARAAILIAALVVAAITAMGQASGGHPLPVPSPSPSSTAGLQAGLLCADKTCPGGIGFICAGGTDCGLWFLRDGCGDCPQLILAYDLRLYTARDVEVLTGRIVFAAGETRTTLIFLPTAWVTSIHVQLANNGVVVFQQTVTG